MKSLSIKSILLAFGLSLSVLAFAQQGPPPGGRGGRGGDPAERAERQAQRLKEDLSLTDEQYEEVKAINLVAAEQIQEIYQNNAGDREAMRSAMMEVREETNEQMEAVLTPEQWTKFQEIQEQRRGNRQGRRPGGGEGERR